MPRKGPAPRRDLVADPIYRSVQVTQLINKVMLHGKRSVAERIVYDAMAIIEAKTEDAPLDTVKRAIENVKPPLEVRSRRVGGATYQVPVEVRPRRATTLAIRWIVDFARARREKNRLDSLLRVLTRPEILILHEVGYLPLEQPDAAFLFEVVNKRYQAQKSIIITSNKSEPRRHPRTLTDIPATGAEW